MEDLKFKVTLSYIMNSGHPGLCNSISIVMVAAVGTELANPFCLFKPRVHFAHMAPLLLVIFSHMEMSLSYWTATSLELGSAFDFKPG